eukprot:CAMPEP_0177633426 /NCGR_PEP_ID=MMETSP0447-20121125/2831_1 /TAXON_ID=0 /ORGANISM="Stygamoeba regulata, Strain BSH-02190019" /LENGTH=571 /DNA_ID=CAMNT_0019135085 /DNA_START=467 /DNA_END=2182 /DNA_ORIENTATION=-
MDSAPALPLAHDRSYQAAKSALFTLQSNAASIQAWVKTRREDLHASLLPEIRYYLSLLDVDATQLSSVHIAGTKGSTGAMVESILRNHGAKTGFFSSPHLISPRERIRINGRSISEEDFARYFWHVWDTLHNNVCEEYPPAPSFFRFISVMCFYVFAAEKVDVAVMEVGLGGRTDATNVVGLPGLASCGITALGYDHQKVLGETLGEIAFEKAGILKESVPAFTLPQTPEAMGVIRRRAKEVGVSHLRVVEPLTDAHMRGEPLSLSGEHQRLNSALACHLALSWLQKHPQFWPPAERDLCSSAPPQPLPASFTPAATDPLPVPLPSLIRSGLSNCYWPGRCQTVTRPSVYPRTTFYVDGAHTPESVRACLSWFSPKDDSKTVNILIFGTSRDRDSARLLAQFESYLLVTSSSEHLFRHALFTALHTHPSEDAVVESSQKTARSTWIQLLRKQSALRGASGVGSSFPPSSSVSSSTGSSLLADTAEYQLSIEQSLQRVRALIQHYPDSDIRVLVVGSLYLVGGLIDLLDVPTEISFSSSSSTSSAPPSSSSFASSYRPPSPSSRDQRVSQNI